MFKALEIVNFVGFSLCCKEGTLLVSRIFQEENLDARSFEKLKPKQDMLNFTSLKMLTKVY